MRKTDYRAHSACGCRKGELLDAPGIHEGSRTSWRDSGYVAINLR